MTAELSAVDFELGLAGEVVGVGGSYDCGDTERLHHTPQGEGTEERVIRQARASRGNRNGAFADEIGCGKALHGEEVLVSQVADKHGIVGRICEVFASYAVHVQTETCALKLAVGDFELAPGEFDGAAMVVEEIATRPADDAGVAIDLKHAIRARRFAGSAMAFGCETLTDPFGQATTKVSYLGVSS